MRRRRGSSTTSANVIESNVPITSADHLYSFFPRIFFGSGGKEISDEVNKKVKHYYYSKGYCIGSQHKRAREMTSDRIVPRVCMLEETNPFDLFSRISGSTAISSQSYSHVLSYPDDQLGIPDLLKSERAYANHYEKLREKRLISKKSSQNGNDKTKSNGKNDVNGESQGLSTEKERKKRVRYEDEDDEEIEKKDKQKRKSVKREKAELEQSLKEEEEDRLKGGDKNDTHGNDEDEEEISFKKLSNKKTKRNKLGDDGADDGNESGSEDGGNDGDEPDNEEEDEEDGDDTNNIPRKTRLDRSQSIGTEGDDYENNYNQSDEDEFVHEDDNYDDDGGNDDD